MRCPSPANSAPRKGRTRRPRLDIGSRRIDLDQGPTRSRLPKVQAGSGPDAAQSDIVRSSMSVGSDDIGRPRRKRMEIFAFLFLTAVVMPVLAVGVFGSYGLAVWI